ncbi:MAG: WXG100 family type VII secretion target [Clostridiales bacterium]|jgi:WXG100 family type VII secretion target|nr:WXG100 family type VII secretion target [Clostridiales bacterium]
MAEIRVTSAALKEKSNTIKGISANIQSLEAEIRQEVDRVKPAWEGEASEAFNKRYLEIGEELKGIYETIAKYSAFLEEAAAGFAEAETKSVSEAQSVQSGGK